MALAPIRPQPPHVRPAHRAGAAGAAKRPAKAAPEAATPGDLAALAEQAHFDAMASVRAEQQREMNALRDMAMQQVKKDDQLMNEWIKLI
jgi:hypothetical protein